MLVAAAAGFGDFLQDYLLLSEPLLNQMSASKLTVSEVGIAQDAYAPLSAVCHAYVLKGSRKCMSAAAVAVTCHVNVTASISYLTFTSYLLGVYV